MKHAHNYYCLIASPPNTGSTVCAGCWSISHRHCAVTGLLFYHWEWPLMSCRPVGNEKLFISVLSISWFELAEDERHSLGELNPAEAPAVFPFPTELVQVQLWFLGLIIDCILYTCSGCVCFAKQSCFAAVWVTFLNIYWLSAKIDWSVRCGLQLQSSWWIHEQTDITVLVCICSTCDKGLCRSHTLVLERVWAPIDLHCCSISICSFTCMCVCVCLRSIFSNETSTYVHTRTS